MRSRTRRGMSTYVSVVISPATTTRPVVMSVSQATRLIGSSLRTASRTESEIWSAILSGWPSVTDSDVKVKVRADMRPRLAAADLNIGRERALVLTLRAESEEAAEVRQLGRKLDAGEREQRQRSLDVRVGETGDLVRHTGQLLGFDERRLRGELRPRAAELIDPVLRRRDDELAAEHGAVQRQSRERAGLRHRLQQAVERRRRGGGVIRRGDERQLRSRQRRANVEGGLAAEDRVELHRQVVDVLAEELLERRRQLRHQLERGQRHREVGNREDVGRDLVDERRA